MTHRTTRHDLPLRRQLEQQQQGGGGQAPATPVVPAATPPVTESSAEVVQASQDLRRQALRKRGFSKTYLAGDTGGWFPGNSTPSPSRQAAPINVNTGAPAGGKLGG